MPDTKNIHNPEPDALAATMQQVFDALPIGVMIVDADSYKIVSINHTYAHFLEGAPINQNLVGQTIIEVGATAPTFAVIRSVVASGKEVTVEEFAYDGFARGRTYWRWVATPLQDDGRTVYVVITAEEMTARVVDRQNMVTSLTEEQRLRDENRLLYEVSSRLSSTIALEQILQDVVNQVSELVAAEWVTVLLWDEQLDGLRVGAVSRIPSDQDPNLELDYIIPLGKGVSGRTFSEGRVIEELNYQQTNAPALLKELTEREQIGSYLGAPISYAGQKLGVITLGRQEPTPFGSATKSLILLLAEQIGVALTRAQLYSDTREKEMRLRELLAIDERITTTLLEVAAMVAGAVTQEQIMTRVVGMLPGFIGCDRASITLYDAEENVSRLGAASGITPEQERILQEQPSAPVDLTEPLTYRLIVEHQAVIINAEQIGEDNPFNIQSAMFVPMVARERVLGFIGLDQAEAAHHFTEVEQRLMQGIADMIALALENAALLESNTRAASLVEANRLKDEFLGIASHELKTPMTTIQGYVQVLRRRASQENMDKAALIRVVDTINDQTRRMNRLVDELLDISRIEAGRLEIHREVVDLEQLLIQVVEQQQMTNDQVAIHLRVGENATHLKVVGDEARLQQVALNLLSNALKYSPEGGSVSVGLQREDNAAVVSVRDQGVGISEEEQAHLFERFFRTEGARQSGVSGLGLGLYIASSIVMQHGGRMWVASQPGQGSAFFFSVPLAHD